MPVKGATLPQSYYDNNPQELPPKGGGLPMHTDTEQAYVYTPPSPTPGEFKAIRKRILDWLKRKKKE
jgi:hypothetical protein